MKLVDINQNELSEYVTRQLSHFYPDNKGNPVNTIARSLSDTLVRLHTCINSVRMWEPDQFYYLHSEQYTTFLYYLANTIWRTEEDSHLCNKLFCLNKALNGFNCFYDVELPDKFFIGHSVGIVLSKTTYEDYLVLYQNSTVGKNHGIAPQLAEGVVLYPNSAIIGDCDVGARTVICQSTSVINQSPPGNCFVFQGNGKELIYKDYKRDVLNDIFRD